MNKKRKAGKERRRDRLSRLPEPIIHHILSFLATRSAVQTSVLSRSWRSAWKHVPVLDFSHYRFSDLFGSATSSSNCNLETLELEGFEIDSGFGSPGFRMLTSLDLWTCLVACGEEEVLEPFSNFPCLKHLSLRDLLGDFLFRLMKIHGLELLSLKLHTVKFYRIEIDAPKLKFFGIWDDVEWLYYSNLSLPSLDHADIGLHGKLRFDEEDKECVALQLINLFRGLQNAKSLNLYRDTTIPVTTLVTASCIHK
ncbi:unnamed protein product [Linum tenue]|uniref:F-box domain-containing protein n=1 Tax=Linum tenue TaxID=586396 RepID=A0AAV0QCW9_9ROSI|nr:unnamed protein product [Linum tenue]